MNDTRKYKRSAVSLRVRFKSATLDDFIEEFSDDVSMGGIFIRSSDPLAVGTLIKFLFLLSDNSTLIEGVGRVVWKREDDNPGMGIKFIKMSEESRQCLDMILSGPAGDDDLDDDLDEDAELDADAELDVGVGEGSEEGEPFSVYTDGGTTSGSLGDIAIDEELFPEDDEPGYDGQDTRVHDVADFALEMEAMLARERQGESFEEGSDTTQELADAIRESLEEEPDESGDDSKDASGEEDAALSDAHPIAAEPEDSDLETVMESGLGGESEKPAGPSSAPQAAASEVDEPESSSGTGLLLLAVGVVLIIVLGYNVLQEAETSETREAPSNEVATPAPPEEPPAVPGVPDAEQAMGLPLSDAGVVERLDAEVEADVQGADASLDGGEAGVHDASMDASMDAVVQDAEVTVHRLVVITAPAGATVRLGDEEQVSPATFSLNAPGNLTTLSVSLEGYRNQTARVRRSAFRGDGGVLEHRLELTLRPLPAARVNTPSVSSMAARVVRPTSSGTRMARPPARPAMASPAPSGSTPPSNPF